MLQEEDPDEPCERFLEDSPDNVENEIKTEAEEVNAANEEKTEDSSSAVHIKKVTFSRDSSHQCWVSGSV